MTTAVLPRRIAAYRCEGCWQAYQRSKDGLRAINLAAMVSLVAEPDGLFSCPCGSPLRFGWDS